MREKISDIGIPNLTNSAQVVKGIFNGTDYANATLSGIQAILL